MKEKTLAILGLNSLSVLSIKRGEGFHEDCKPGFPGLTSPVAIWPRAGRDDQENFTSILLSNNPPTGLPDPAPY